MTQQQHNQENTPVGDLSSSVLQKIESEHVTVVPRWQFVFTEYSIWTLWGLSVLIGAVAFSVMIFFTMHAGYALYEATHESALRFFLDIMPYAWVVVFVVMAILAHYNLRHTKRGYKYQVWQVLLSSIVFSFVGGLLLHAVGTGFFIDNYIAKKMPLFPALHSLEARMWQSPLQGRMIGTFSGREDEHVVLFTDVAGTSWRVITRELNPSDLDSLYSGKKVRVIGLPATTTQEAYFHGCGVFPWHPEKKTTIDELRQEREAFIDRMLSHQKKVFEEILATGTVPDFVTKPVCATHSAVMRVQR